MSDQPTRIPTPKQWSMSILKHNHLRVAFRRILNSEGIDSDLGKHDFVLADMLIEVLNALYRVEASEEALRLPPIEGELHITCDRCHRKIDGFRGANVTAGFYDVTGLPWLQFADEGEEFICDECMWTDARYIAVYGEQK